MFLLYWRKSLILKIFIGFSVLGSRFLPAAPIRKPRSSDVSGLFSFCVQLKISGFYSEFFTFPSVFGMRRPNRRFEVLVA